MKAPIIALSAQATDTSAAAAKGDRSIANLQKTDPEEWRRHFRAWAESHDRTTPLLSDKAISRDSLHPYLL